MKGHSAYKHEHVRHGANHEMDQTTSPDKSGCVCVYIYILQAYRLFNFQVHAMSDTYIYIYIYMADIYQTPALTMKVGRALSTSSTVCTYAHSLVFLQRLRVVQHTDNNLKALIGTTWLRTKLDRTL